MKIGILTFHDGINHGGFLQAYSTLRFLQSCGHDVEIINYKNRTHYFNEYKAFFLTKNPSKLVKNLGKILKFKKAKKCFQQHHLTTNPKDLVTEYYDAVVIGADIVWNYQWPFLGSDPIYFGVGLNVNKLVAYAPSCGNLNIERPIPDFVMGGLQRFSAIAVRDELTQQLVHKATGMKPQVVLDPTFLHDCSGDEANLITDSDYLLVYAYQLSVIEISIVKEFARKKNLRIISVGYYNSWCDENRVSIGPFEWLSYFKSATVIVTSTFHGTIYAIKYKKHFVTSNNPEISAKTETLLKQLGLENQLTDHGAFPDVLANTIDYSPINHTLSLLIKDSKRYLIEALND